METADEWTSLSKLHVAFSIGLACYICVALANHGMVSVGRDLKDLVLTPLHKQGKYSEISVLGSIKLGKIMQESTP